MYEKPMTENQKINGNKLYNFIKNNGLVTKEQMLKFLGWDKSKDRQLRDLISRIAELKPVIATSDQKGYRIAQTEKDLEEVIHQWKELDSRIESLDKRRKPLIKFYEKFKK